MRGFALLFFSLAELRKSLDAELARWNAAKAQDIPALNLGLQKAGLAATEP